MFRSNLRGTGPLPPNREFRVGLVSDFPLLRFAIAAILMEQNGFSCCGEAEDLEGANELIADLQLDVLFVDLSLKNGVGLEAIREIKSANERLRILVMSHYDDALYAGQALAAGASGYLPKQASPEEVIAAFKHVAEGKVYLTPEASQRMLCRAVQGKSGKSADPISLLTERELQVFELLGGGNSTQRIANQLGLSIHTVETYRERIRAKIDAKNGFDLSFRAIVWVLLNK